MGFRKWCCLPCFLSWQSFKIYVWHTIQAYTPNCWQLCCVCFGRRYQDKKFPSSDQSLGGAAAGKEVVWLTVAEIFEARQSETAPADRHGPEFHALDQPPTLPPQPDHKRNSVALFSTDIGPSDILQGGIGNCWLLSALACLATVPGGVPACFVTKKYNAYGRYSVRMFEKGKGWQNVTVSDSFPCDARRKRPLFAKPNGQTAWVHIMEKAFAKFMGSYAALEGGSTTFALEVLTGDCVCQWNFDASTRTWENHDLVHGRDGDGGRAFGVRKTGEQLTEYSMFQYLRTQWKKRSLIAASAGGGTDRQSRSGILLGHAYSILRLKEIDGFRLVQFRNPWGKFEWLGAWSDASLLWEVNPLVAQKLNHTAADDGCFWMDWGDVQRHFDSIDLCIRIRDFHDMELEYNEHLGCCGPCCGCLNGCATFWCCCRGCRMACVNAYDVRQAENRAVRAKYPPRLR